MPAERGYSALLRSLPLDWPTAEISAVAKVVGGGTPSRDVPGFWGGGIPWVTPGEVSGEGSMYLSGTRESISAVGLAASGATIVPTGSLMITTRATLGARAINTVPMTTNQGFKSLVFEGAHDAPFYYYLTERLKPELKRRASGTTFLEVSGAELAKIEVPVPPVEERLCIAEVLDTLDTTIRQTEAIIEKLKQVKQGLLHDLLTRGIDANGELRPPHSQAPHLYKDSPLGWIPNEWRAENVGAVIDGSPRNGIYKPAGNIGSGVLLVGQTAFTTQGSVDFGHARRAQVTNPELEVFGLLRDDLLVSRVFATREGVGQPVLVPDPPEPAVYESNMMRLRVRRQCMLPRLLFLWLKHRTARAWITSRAFASNQASVNRDTVGSLPVPVQPTEEQAAILAVERALEQRQSAESIELRTLQALKSGLMDDLLTGRVRVTPLLEAAHA